MTKAPLERKYLKDLTKAVQDFLEGMDGIMHTSASAVARGKHIGRLCNALELHNDVARHFGLGIDLKKDKRKVRTC